MENQQLFNKMKLSKTKMWLMFLFFGWSYGSMGSMTKQVFFYLTAGGCGLWTIYVFFTLNKKIKRYNTNLALESGMSVSELLKNGLL